MLEEGRLALEQGLIGLDPVVAFKPVARLVRNWELAVPAEFRTAVPWAICLAAAVARYAPGSLAGAGAPGRAGPVVDQDRRRRLPASIVARARDQQEFQGARVHTAEYLYCLILEGGSKGSAFATPLISSTDMSPASVRLLFVLRQVTFFFSHRPKLA